MCKDAEEKKRLLAYLACSDAVAWMHEVMKYFLEGMFQSMPRFPVWEVIQYRVANFGLDIATDIREISANLKNIKHEMIGVWFNGQVDTDVAQHVFLWITLKQSRDKYVVDLTGAQFGYYDPVTPLAEYMSSRVKNIIGSGNEFGACRKTMVAAPKDSSVTSATIYVNMKISEALLGSMTMVDEATTNGKQAKGILGLDNEEMFQKQKKLALMMVDVNLRGWMDEVKKSYASQLAKMSRW